jgi:hypothetical protein
LMKRKAQKMPPAPRRFNSFKPDEIAVLRTIYDSHVSLLKAARAAGLTESMMRRIRDAEGWELKVDRWGRPIGDNKTGYYSFYDSIETGR